VEKQTTVGQKRRSSALWQKSRCISRGLGFPQARPCCVWTDQIGSSIVLQKRRVSFHLQDRLSSAPDPPVPRLLPLIGRACQRDQPLDLFDRGELDLSEQGLRARMIVMRRVAMQGRECLSPGRRQEPVCSPGMYWTCIGGRAVLRTTASDRWCSHAPWERHVCSARSRHPTGSPGSGAASGRTYSPLEPASVSPTAMVWFAVHREHGSFPAIPHAGHAYSSFSAQLRGILKHEICSLVYGLEGAGLSTGLIFAGMLTSARRPHLVAHSPGDDSAHRHLFCLMHHLPNRLIPTVGTFRDCFIASPLACTRLKTTSILPYGRPLPDSFFPVHRDLAACAG
jgi:hypothetical protein